MSSRCAQALGALLLGAALLLSRDARAEGPEAVVLDVKGPGAAALRRGLERALGAERIPVRSDGLRSQPPAPSVRAAARKHAAKAVVIARAERHAGRTEVSVRVFRGSTGAPLEFLRWRARTPGDVPDVEAAQLQEALARAAGRTSARPSLAAESPQPAAAAPVAAAAPTEVSPALTSPAAPPRPAPARAAPAPVASAPRAVEPRPAPSEVEAPSDEVGPVAARLSVGGRVVSRHLQYTDDLRGALPSYRLPGGPALAVGVEWYPGALVTHGLWANVGVMASAEILMGVSSVMPDGSEYNTDSDAYRAGLLLRLPLGRGELGLQGSFGSHGFAFRQSTRGGAELLVPGVRYRSARGGLFGRIPVLERLTLVLEAGAHKVWEAGELGETFFPRNVVGAVDGTLAAEYHLGEAWRLRVGADYRRYYYAMHPEPGDRFIVGGALDEYLTGTVSLGFELR